MKTLLGCALLAALILSGPGEALSASAGLDEIVAKIENRYDVPGFTADFHQVSTIKAMNVADEATGKVFVRKPSMMRWEYETPEPQVIVTNGDQLWIYRPVDNQVILGKSPAFFAGGKGAGFLADIKVLRRKFDISAAPSDDERYYALKLVPVEKTIEVAEILLYAAKDTFTVRQVVTVNTYGDETRITLLDSRFDQVPELSLFSLEIPPGTDVVTMDE